jgi:hypothetical protein
MAELTPQFAVGPKQYLGITAAVDAGQRAEVEELLAGVADGAERVLTRAVNKVGTAARTRIARQVAQQVNVKISELRERNITLQKANYRLLEARIHISGRRIPLMKFAARQTRKGVSYAIRRGGRLMMLGAFLATMTSGHRGVFARRYAEGRIERLRGRLEKLQGRRKTRMSLREAAEGTTRRARTITALAERIRQAEADERSADRRVARLPIQEAYGPSVVEVVRGLPEMASGELERGINQDLAGEVNTQLGLVLGRRVSLAEAAG